VLLHFVRGPNQQDAAVVTVGAAAPSVAIALEGVNDSLEATKVWVNICSIIFNIVRASGGQFMPGLDVPVQEEGMV
jgi:hypothetical protein